MIVRPAMQVLFIFTLLSGYVISAIPQSAEAAPLVIGNTVSVSNSNVYIMANPATLTASGWVEITFQLLSYEGPVDVVYGFNGLDNVKAINPQVWESYQHTKTRQVDAVKTAKFKPGKVISVNTRALRSAKADTDLSLNSKYAEITYVQTDPITVKTGQHIIKLAYDTYDSSTGVYSYKYNGQVSESYTETYVDWNAKAQPTITALSHAGASKWDITQYKSVVRNEVQKTRVWIDIPFSGKSAVSGKYNIGIKPSNLTLQQAKDQDKLWLLDPWYSASWSYRKAITVTDASADYQTKILIGKTSGATGEDVDCNGHCLDTFADLRFTGADGTTLLDYWIESVAASGTSYLATVWVQNNATPDTTLYMYYGNAGAADAGNGVNTFVFFDDFDDASLDTAARWTTGSSDGAGTWVESGGVLTITPHTTAADTAYVTSKNTYGTNYALRSRMKISSTASTVTYAGFAKAAGSLTAIELTSIERFSSEETNFTAIIGDGANYDIKDLLVAGDTNYHIFQTRRASGVDDKITIDNGADVVGQYDTTQARYITALTYNYGTRTQIILDWIALCEYAATAPSFAFGTESIPSCALTGTVTTAVESDIVTGGKTIILTLTNSTWVASGATFDAQRDDIIAGMDSAQSEAGGWDAVYKANATTYAADVVRTNDTVVTVTMSALAAYSITADETITVTIPTTALVTTAALVASPTFVITNESVTIATVTLSAASTVQATTATLNGNITNVGSGNPTVTVYWGTTDHPGTSVGWDHNAAPTSPAQPQGIAAFYYNATSLSTGTTYYFTAKATNGSGDAWPAASLSFLTKPAAPTAVSATDGTDSTKVVVTWTKSYGATNYHVWRDAVDLGAAGDVATADDTGAGAPTITPGTASATDGTSSTEVTLNLAGVSAANGTSHTYKVVASNATGNSADSTTDTGYRGVTSLTYAWQVSSGTGDSGFGAIGGGTTVPYSYTSAPAPVITPGTAAASDATSSSYSTLTVAGHSAANGTVRYYYCIVSMTGAANADTTHNDGYRGTATLTYAWQRSAGDADNTFGAIGGATTNPYNDTDAVVTPDGRYYYCIISMSGASNADTTHDRGYKLAFAAPTVVTGISSGSGTSWSILNGLVTAQGDAAVSQYGIEYGATTGYGTELLTIANVANNVNYWQTLTGLSTSTQYHYRAKAFNTAWGYGTDAIFATKGSPAITTYFNTADDNQTTIWGINTAAQTFTTSATTEYTVTSVRIKMLRVGYPGIVTVSVRHATAGAANSPTGTDLASGAINGNLLDTSAAWYEIPMTTETTLELNSPYCIVVGAASGDSSNYINWRMANAGGLANGNADTSANSGVTWTPQTYDYMFELWGNQALEILSTKVFTGYKSTGDWLIIADTKNTYTPYYPNEDPQTLFQMQLINGSTIVASTTVKAWQRQPLSIFLNSTTAGTLTWGDSYKLRLSLIPNPAIMSEYPLQAVDWQAGDLVYLDGFVRNLAGVYQTYYTTLTGTTVTYLISGANGLLLNQDGAVIFKRGIPELDSIRPDLFQTTQQILPTPNTPITPQAGMTRISLAARVGPLVYTTLTNTGNTMGMTADQFLSFCLWACIIICALSCGAGFFIGGLIAGIGFVGIGLVLGGMNLVWVILAAFGCIIIIGLRIFIQNNG